MGRDFDIKISFWQFFILAYTFQNATIYFPPTNSALQQCEQIAFSHSCTLLHTKWYQSVKSPPRNGAV